MRFSFFFFLRVGSSSSKAGSSWNVHPTQSTFQNSVHLFNPMFVFSAQPPDARQRNKSNGPERVWLALNWPDQLKSRLSLPPPLDRTIINPHPTNKFGTRRRRKMRSQGSSDDELVDVRGQPAEKGNQCINTWKKEFVVLLFFEKKKKKKPPIFNSPLLVSTAAAPAAPPPGSGWCVKSPAATATKSLDCKNHEL